MTRAIFYTLKKQERRRENLVKESNNVQEKTAGSFLNNRPEQSGEVIDLDVYQRQDYDLYGY